MNKMDRSAPTFGWAPIAIAGMAGVLSALAPTSWLALGGAVFHFGMLLCVLADEVIVAIKESRP